MGNPTGNNDPSAGRERGRRQGKRNRSSHDSKGSRQWDESQFPVPDAPGRTRFHDLGLPPEVMHAIADLGFEYCSPIQAQILPHTLDGHDAIGKAQTGTGKTAAFLITIINDLLNNPVAEERFAGEPRALVIAPTRELVMQIADDAHKLCKYLDIGIAVLIGGVDYQRQVQKLESKVVDIVVATPGRLLDCQRRGDLHLDLVEILVLDEADRMLDMGFIPQVKQILRATPPKTHRQTMLISATINQDVLNLSYQWTVDPIMVEIEPERVATDSVEQKVYLVSEREKLPVLQKILATDELESAIVFCNRRHTTTRIFERLQRAGFRVGMLSGEVPQHKRTKTLEDFKQGRINVLVATDVAGRGLHVEGVSHVVNYDVPEDPEDYVHRIGRTGRAGATGISITFAGEADAFLIPDLEKLLGY
ncbi:MAG: ATP-dependent RNA helicase RhlB, partial [Methylococcaceae bacterium]|nr:ATP-dependent RNA helicase RhlB [Methylococcaceae bacterium]